MARKAGVRMVKSEVVPVRFDPLLKWAVEMAGGVERRSFSSTVERAAEIFVKNTKFEAENGDQVSVWDVAETCWNPNPLLRLTHIACRYFKLLTFEERNQWNAILLLIAIERNLSLPPADEFPVEIDANWVPAMSAVWEYIVENANDLNFYELRARYLEAREAFS